MSGENIRVAEIEANIRLAQARENTRVAEEYIAAMKTRNLEALGKNLHPQLHFVGPTGETHNRESFLETMQKVFSNLEKVNVTSHYSSKDQTAYVYNMFFAAPAGSIQTGSLITHEDGKIKKIEIIDDSKFLEEHFKRR